MSKWIDAESTKFKTQFYLKSETYRRDAKFQQKIIPYWGIRAESWQMGRNWSELITFSGLIWQGFPLSLHKIIYECRQHLWEWYFPKEGFEYFICQNFYNENLYISWKCVWILCILYVQQFFLKNFIVIWFKNFLIYLALIYNMYRIFCSK